MTLVGHIIVVVVSERPVATFTSLVVIVQTQHHFWRFVRQRNRPRVLSFPLAVLAKHPLDSAIPNTIFATLSLEDDSHISLQTHSIIFSACSLLFYLDLTHPHEPVRRHLHTTAQHPIELANDSLFVQSASSWYV